MVEKRYADTVLVNARVLTMDPGNPEAWFVAVKGDKIIGVGDAEGARQFKGPHTRQVDCQGTALLPGFNDAHCHLLALASSLRGVDCRPDMAGSIPHVIKAISRQAESSPPGEWIRAFGYDEFYLVEKRHPTRWDLDLAAPFHPVRLDHRTGHASVLNSIALDLLHISRDTADPVDGVVGRDEATGEPTGVLFEMGDYLARATRASRTCTEGNRMDEDRILEGLRRVDRLLLSKGITSIQDASPGNDLDRWQTFHKLTEEGVLRPRVTMMAGASHLQSFLDAGLIPGSGDEGLRLGAIKLMLTLTTGSLRPHREELEHLVLSAHGNGYQMAIHAVEHEVVEAAVDVLIKAQTVLRSPDTRHRIEHCFECPPGLVGKLQRSRTLVVTQPSFIYHNGQKVPLRGRGRAPASPVPRGCTYGGWHNRGRRFRRARHPTRSHSGNLLCRDTQDQARLHRVPPTGHHRGGGAENAHHKRRSRLIRRGKEGVPSGRGSWRTWWCWTGT